MWNDRHPMNSLLWEAAIDDMGIYPRAIVRDGVEEPRTPFQDGWNAAVIALTTKHAQLLTWVQQLPETQRTALETLLDHDAEPVRLSVHEGTVKILAGCSDTFMYACSDAEEVPLEAFDEVARLWQTHGYPGIVAWIAQRRRQEPVKEYRYDAHYLAAKAALVAEEPPRD